MVVTMVIRWFLGLQTAMARPGIGIQGEGDNMGRSTFYRVFPTF